MQSGFGESGVIVLDRDSLAASAGGVKPRISLDTALLLVLPLVL